MIVSHGTITSCEKQEAHADDRALYFADGAFRTLIIHKNAVLCSTVCSSEYLDKENRIVFLHHFSDSKMRMVSQTRGHSQFIILKVVHVKVLRKESKNVLSLVQFLSRLFVFLLSRSVE